MHDSLIALLEYLAQTKDNPRVVLDFKNGKIAILFSTYSHVIDYTQEEISKAIEDLEKHNKP